MPAGTILDKKLTDLGRVYGLPWSSRWKGFRKAVLDTVEANKKGRFAWQPDSEKHRAVFQRLDLMEKEMTECTGTHRLMACDRIIDENIDPLQREIAQAVMLSTDPSATSRQSNEQLAILKLLDAVNAAYGLTDVGPLLNFRQTVLNSWRASELHWPQKGQHRTAIETCFHKLCEALQQANDLTAKTLALSSAASELASQFHQLRLYRAKMNHEQYREGLDFPGQGAFDLSSSAPQFSVGHAARHLLSARQLSIYSGVVRRRI